MSRVMNQKFKFTYIMQIMLEKTDDEHSLTLMNFATVYTINSFEP